MLAPTSRKYNFPTSGLQPCGSRNNAHLRQRLGHSNHHETGANSRYAKGKGMRDSMRGFTLIELLIVIAIILIIAAMAIPNLLHSRIAANEASAVSSIRSINSAEVSYQAAYPTHGYAAKLADLGGGSPCTPSPTSACLVDRFLP